MVHPDVVGIHRTSLEEVARRHHWRRGIQPGVAGSLGIRFVVEEVGSRQVVEVGKTVVVDVEVGVGRLACRRVVEVVERGIHLVVLLPKLQRMHLTLLAQHDASSSVVEGLPWNWVGPGPAPGSREFFLSCQ